MFKTENLLFAKLGQTTVKSTSPVCNSRISTGISAETLRSFEAKAKFLKNTSNIKDMAKKIYA